MSEGLNGHRGAGRQPGSVLATLIEKKECPRTVVRGLLEQGDALGEALRGQHKVILDDQNLAGGDARARYDALWVHSPGMDQTRREEAQGQMGTLSPQGNPGRSQIAGTGAGGRAGMARCGQDNPLR